MNKHGSSPLARGLPFPGALPGVEAGIIPARAGFTSPPSTWTPGSSDHPRSRGVYSRWRCPWDLLGGSSPLARGLLAPRARQRPRRGDHPRSRGVYLRRSLRGLLTYGSSPLARGLRHGDPGHGPLRWIIPARAGFTPWRRCGRVRCSDHPRSRGVYVEAVPRAGAIGRIIPARAGFTIPWPSLAVSVLARIIPARAGFTVLGIHFGVPFGDHPRSRGVYPTTTDWIISRMGSSPLARGLLADPWNPNEPVLYQTPAAFTADPGPAPPSCGSAVVVPRWTTTPSGA